MRARIRHEDLGKFTWEFPEIRHLSSGCSEQIRAIKIALLGNTGVDFYIFAQRTILCNNGWIKTLKIDVLTDSLSTYFDHDSAE